MKKVITLIISVIPMILYFMVLACKNPTLHAAYKGMWCALFYCLNVWAFPVYWFLYIRTENRLVKDASE